MNNHCTFLEVAQSDAANSTACEDFGEQVENPKGHTNRYPPPGDQNTLTRTSPPKSPDSPSSSQYFVPRSFASEHLQHLKQRLISYHAFKG